ncbi:MAG: aconitase X [Anaerolineae bacterium]
MKLTPEEQAMLAGEEGEATRRAIEIVVTLGRIYGAGRLLPVESVQVAGVSYRNIGEAGLAFLRDWAAQGARVRVPTTLNPAGMDLSSRGWRAMGVSEAFAQKQQELVDVYAAMGITPTCTCTPYLVGHNPHQGATLAWSESSAVCFANAVLGARSNREGGPSALAAAICGRTADYGLHRDEQRRATHRAQVRCPVVQPHEFAALGYLVGKQVGNGVPYFEGLDLADGLDVDGSLTPQLRDALKLMGAALASSGAVALYHVAGVTPEARERQDLCAPDLPTVTVDSLDAAMAELDGPLKAIDLVVVGCPHASFEELRDVAEGVRGKRLVAKLWVTTSRGVRDQADSEGLVQAIEEAGGLVVADGCVVVAPMRELAFRSLATNSAKMAAYALPHASIAVRFGSLQQCLRAAERGVW